MEKKRISSGKTVSMPVGVGIGGFTSFLITLASSAVIAKLIDSESLPVEKAGYGIMLLLLVSSFLGAKAAYFRVRRRKLLVSTLSGFLYMAILLSITALFFGGQYEAVGVTCGLVLAGSMSAGLLGFQRKGKGRGKRPQRVHR